MLIESDSDCDDFGSSSDEDVVNMFAPIYDSDDEADVVSSHINHSHNFSGEGSSSSGSNGSSSKIKIGANFTYKPMVSHDVKPDVPEEFKPNNRMMFKKIDDAINMYKEYAYKAGFDVSKTTSRRDGDIIIHKYLVCHRSGNPPDASVDNFRKTIYKSTGCKAKIVVKIIKGTTDYKFERFYEFHNHEMEDIEYLMRSRELSYSDMEYMLLASRVKIGSSKAHKLKVALKGGFENVRGNVNDYKNFMKKMGDVIGPKDAQLIVNKLTDRKDNYPNFSFYHRVDEETKVLNALFWVDEAEKAYYSEFGDVLSFDATFRTNKYDLVFVPFTVIDHHKSSVTVGAGLLSNEDIDSYKWLLEHFLKAHGNKHPVLVLTDQDASLKQAVDVVFSGSKHRLCMWHIMRKVRKKVGLKFYKTKNFKTRFKKIVWDLYIKPDVFEYKWNQLMEEFAFQGKTKTWFKKMYDERDSWIPAYFNEYPRCGLMKTTSRSESMNSFFNSYSQGGNYLINFLMNYDNAIQRLRYKQRDLDHKTKKAQYILKTPRDIEKHAARVYTSKLFFEVQKEMFKGSWYCDISEVIEGYGWEIYTVNHNTRKHVFKEKYKVELRIAEKKITCSCGHFNRVGILCRHAFKILLNKDVKEIPDEYVLRRFRKDVIYANYNLSRDRFDDRDAAMTKLVNDAHFNFESCLDYVRDDKEKLALFVQTLQGILEKLKSDPSSKVSKKAIDVLEKIYGMVVPDEVDIQVPNVQNNKGCRRKKRLVSEVDNVILRTQSKIKKCTGCNIRVRHNVRTCPVKKRAAANNQK